MRESDISSVSEFVVSPDLPTTAELSPDLLSAFPLPLASDSKDHKRLENTAINATVWTIVSYGATQVLRMGNNIVLTRLLLPEYFGLMALLTTLVTGMTLLSDVGLLPSVIGSPRGDEPAFLNTAWTLQIVRGLVLWVIALLLSWPFALLYHDHRIAVLMPSLSFSLVLNGLASANLMRAARHIRVRRLLLIDLVTQFFGIVVMLVWALIHPTVWALVGGTLAAAAAKTILSHLPFVLPGERNRLVWDRDSVRSLISFGKWIMLGTAFYFFAAQSDRLILGRLLTFTMLGVYNIAFTIADIPRQVILQFCNRVGLPFVAKMNHLPLPEFHQKVLKYRLYLLSAGALILSLVVMLGGPLILKVYDSRYHAASWMVPILALGLWHTLLYSTTGSVLFSMGKAKYNAIGTACFCLTMFVSLPIAFHYFGLLGAVISVAAGDFPFYVVLGIGAAREKISLWGQDAVATGIFVGLLLFEYGLRRLVF